jgi:WD40 repeat protein
VNLRYNAFISYSHQSDRAFARAFQSGLEQLAKPWNGRRALNVFRDETDLSVSPELLASVFQRVDQSSNFLLLASPLAAISKWVEQEVEYWVSERGCRSLLIILTGGELAWDDKNHDFDWDRTDALPRCLRGKFAAEPLWVDFRWARQEPNLTLKHERFRDSVATVAAELHGMSKRDLVGEDLRQYRKFLRVKRTATVTGAVLLAGVLVASYFALQQTRRAEERLRVTQSQELAARGRSLAKERLDVALLLTLEAYRTAPTAQARTALLETLQYSPYLARFVLPPSSTARTAAFSSDGAMIAIATESKSVDLRPAQDLGRIMATLRTPEVVYSLFFTADNRKLVTCYGNNGVSVWDIDSRTSVDEPWADHKSRRFCMALSPDGTKLACRTDDNALMLWDIVRSQPVGKMMSAPLTSVHSFGHDKNGKRVEGWSKASVTLNAVVFGPDGNTLAAAYDDRTIVLWNARTGTRIGKPLEGHSSFVKTVAFSPDGTRLVSGSQDQTLRFWDPATGRAASKPLEAHGHWITQAAFSPDGKEVVSAGFDGALILWNISEGTASAYPLQERLRGHAAPVQTLQWNREGGQILTVASDGSVILWRDTFQNVNLMPALNVSSISLSGDGDLLASGGNGGAVIIWNMRTRTATRALRAANENEIKAVAISPDGGSVAAADANSITIWNIGTGQPLASRERPHEPKLTALAYSPSGAVVASTGRDGLIRMWRASDLSPLYHPLRGDKWEEFLHLAFSPDGKTLVSSGRSGLVRFWDMGTLEPDSEPIHADGDETRLAFSPDGKRLVTGTDHAVIEIWDVRSRKREGTPIDAKGVVTGVAFSPDGNIFSTGNGDGLVRLWDSGGHAILEPALRAHSSHINGIAFDPKGRYVAACAHDGIAVIDLMPQDWAVQICERVGRNLTRAEWAQSIPRQLYRMTCPELVSRD